MLRIISVRESPKYKNQVLRNSIYLQNLLDITKNMDGNI